MAVKPQPIQSSLANKTNVIFVVLLAVAAFLLGSLWTEVRYLKKTNSEKGSPTANNPSLANPPSAVAYEDVKPISREDHIRDSRNAQILLVEYSDLECPFCKEFHPVILQAIKDYQGQFALVFRHFPLDLKHPKARKEAEATECAGELGGEKGFWNMVDKIFEVTPSNNGLNLDDLPKLAGQIGLNQQSFKNCLDSGKFVKKVEDDYQSGIKAKVTGTPGDILINTKTKKIVTLPGYVSLEQLKQAIDSLLAEK